MKKSIFISLNYAPGLLKEMLSISDELRNKNNNFIILLSEEYKWMIKDESNIIFLKFFFLKFGKFGQILEFPSIFLQLLKTFRDKNINSCIIYNISIFNGIIFIICFLLGIKKRVLFLHEPFKEKEFIEGFIVKAYFYFAELIQSLPLLLSSDVVLMSPNGEKIFRSRYTRYKGSIIGAHLTIPDYRDPKSEELKRKYFTVVGRFNQIKKINYFLDYVQWSIKSGNNHHFQIVTSSDISKQIKSLPNAMRKYILIKNPKNLSDKVIFESLLQSRGVLLLQPVITQSGVLPVSFMCGTPVIALNNPGFSQYVQNKKNGFLINDQKDYKSILNSIEFIDSNFLKLSLEARKTYIKYFCPKNVRKYLSNIV